jgi:hypothetical protein
VGYRRKQPERICLEDVNESSWPTSYPPACLLGYFLSRNVGSVDHIHWVTGFNRPYHRPPSPAVRIIPVWWMAVCMLDFRSC